MKEGLPGGGLSVFLGDSHDDSWADAPPIFSPWRKRAAPGPKDTPGGGFRSPPPGPPLQTTQRGGCGPLFGNSPHGAAAGREAGRIDKHPGMRYYVVACGISVGGEARYSAPGWNWASLRKAGYQPFASPNLPGRASLDQAAFSSTVHGAFFFAKTKKNGGCKTRLYRGARPVSGPAYDIKQMR